MLFEDKKQASRGIIKGELTTNFIIGDKERFRYNALMFAADRFSNNQFRGTWTSYPSRISKKCNWAIIEFQTAETWTLEQENLVFQKNM